MKMKKIKLIAILFTGILLLSLFSLGCNNANAETHLDDWDGYKNAVENTTVYRSSPPSIQITAGYVYKNFGGWIDWRYCDADVYVKAGLVTGVVVADRVVDWGAIVSENYTVNATLNGDGHPFNLTANSFTVVMSEFSFWKIGFYQVTAFSCDANGEMVEHYSYSRIWNATQNVTAETAGWHHIRVMKLKEWHLFIDGAEVALGNKTKNLDWKPKQVAVVSVGGFLDDGKAKEKMTPQIPIGMDAMIGALIISVGVFSRRRRKWVK